MRSYTKGTASFKKIGRVIANWEQVGPTIRVHGTNRVAVCRCLKCDTHHLVWMHQVTSGRSKQCVACGNKQHSTHGQSHVKGSVYSVWHGMKTRCTNSASPGWDRYGGRGIQVHPEWIGPGGFEKFYAHVGDRPTPRHQLDRIDNDGNYEPGNVRWALPIVNVRNSSCCLRLTIDDETKVLTEWAELPESATASVIRARLRLGWNHKDAVFGKGVPCVTS